MTQASQNDVTPNTEQLRAQAALLLSKARGESFDIRRALGEVNIDSPLHARLAALAAQISDAASGLSQALRSTTFPLRAADLLAFESVVQSPETEALLAQATTEANTNASRTITVAAASADTRQEVRSLSHDVFDRHIFDPYLHFDSPEDEADFRKREAEAQKYINEQLARRTPEGNLNAGGGMIGTMLDANAHGAGNSPDFMPRWNALTADTQRQRAAMHAAGQSTEEYDRNVTDSVRRFLKAKGLSDAEIDKRLSDSANPLDAMKPFLADDRESRRVEEKIQLSRHVAQANNAQALPVVETTQAEAPASKDTLPTINPDVMGAKLQAAIVQISDNTDAGHGVTIQRPAGKGALTVAD